MADESQSARQPGDGHTYSSYRDAHELHEASPVHIFNSTSNICCVNIRRFGQIETFLGKVKIKKKHAHVSG